MQPSHVLAAVQSDNSILLILVDQIIIQLSILSLEEKKTLIQCFCFSLLIWMSRLILRLCFIFNVFSFCA